MAHYRGSVTPATLFRGAFPGETQGPYLSQFALQPTHLGTLPVPQRYDTFAAGSDFMTALDAWNAVQGGAVITTVAPAGVNGFLRDGRGLGAYTHADELYQAYFIAYLVMDTLGIDPNPDSPYVEHGATTYVHDQPFGTFAGPDIASALGAVAREALDAVWYQKWIVHLRHRPESGGGMVERYLTSDPALRIVPGTSPGDLNAIVLHSKAVAASASRFGSHLLAQAFPEGSPAHPAYPTGHGTVAGACITVLKYFYNGARKIVDGAKNPTIYEPSPDGQSLVPYGGADAGELTVDGELHKLAHNISFGHGIHAGIHWRSDTDASIALGEAVAIEFLRERKRSYQERPTISFTRIDGTTQTI